MKVVGMDGSIHSFKIVFLAAVLPANKVLFCWEFNWSEESSKRRNSKGSCGISKYPKEHYLQKSKKEPLLGIPKTCPN